MGIVPVYHFMLRGDDRVGAPAPYFGMNCQHKFSDSGGSCHKKSVGQRVGKHESKANMINEF